MEGPDEIPTGCRGADTVEVGLEGPNLLEPATPPLLAVVLVAVPRVGPVATVYLLPSSLVFLVGIPDLIEVATPDCFDYPID